jgi:hypothetical protein
MAIVTLACQGPAPASNALKALIKVLALDCDVVPVEAASPTVTVSTANALTGLTSTTVANTWMDCCRALSQQVASAALFGSSPQEDALVTSWLEDAVASLIPVLVSGECKYQVLRYCSNKYNHDLLSLLVVHVPGRVGARVRTSPVQRCELC